MKKTTIALLSLIAIGAVAVASIAAILATSHNGNKMVEMNLDGTAKEIPLSDFDKLRIVSPDSIWEYSWAVSSNCVLNSRINVTVMGKDSITSPYLAVDPEWLKYLSYRIERDSTLVIDFDFHDLSQLLQYKSERRRVNFNGGPINIIVPKESLQSAVCSKEIVLSLNGITAPSVQVQSKYTIVDNSRIGNFAVISDDKEEIMLIISNDSINVMDITSEDSHLLTVAGHGNDINKLIWHNTSKGASINNLKMRTTGIRNISFLPTNPESEFYFSGMGGYNVSTDKVVPDTITPDKTEFFETEIYQY